MQLGLLRHDLQIALQTLDEMKAPSPADLRAFADNLAARLRDSGYDMTAKRVEVNLPDDASADAVEERREDVQRRLLAMLIWDGFE